MDQPANFDELKAFLLDRNRMRMTHIYKPVMLQAVLSRGGQAKKEEIAADFLARDQLQLEHYRRNIVDRMPGVRMERDGILVREDDNYRMAEPFVGLTQSQRLELIAVCERRIEEHIAKSGNPFADRNLDPVPGNSRYEVLKRAGGRCELCGVSHIEVQLDVDHIVPRKKGGTNEDNNLQVLCRTCNAQKRDRDDTDFRAINAAYSNRDQDCVFCDPNDRVIAENELAVLFEDAYPVTPGHSLVISRRHVASYFDLFQSERNAIDQLLGSRRTALIDNDQTIKGFNVGINEGEVSGQTVMHVHVHLIPRRAGDVEDPAGGVRGVIPGKQQYSG